jgi:hypothetical protein
MKTIIAFLLALMPSIFSDSEFHARWITHKDPVEIKYYEVKDLLCKIPDNEREEFVNKIMEFSNNRGLDWRYMLLLMYCESGINPSAKSGSFAGLIMFGVHVRSLLDITIDELVKLSYLEQLDMAIFVLEENERLLDVKLNSFFKLQLSIFMPYWLKCSESGIYPASDIVKQQNYPIVGSDGNVTKESIINAFRRKISREGDILKYFEGKI